MRIWNITVYLFLFSALIVISGCSSESKTLKLAPTKLDFGEVNLGENYQLNVNLTNKYGEDVLINDLSFSNNAIFVIISSNPLPISLANNASCTLTILFTPNQAGNVNETLTIVDSIASKAKTLELVGSGKSVARMDINAKSHDFKTLIINTDQTFDFEIKNEGTDVLSINSASITGSGASAYSITAGGSLPISIPIGQIHTITVKFYPIADVKYDAELILEHNAVDEDKPLIIPITGTGRLLKPEIVLSETSPWDFGTAPTSFAIYKILEMENTGFDDLHVTNVSLITSAEFTLDHIEDSNGNPLNLPLTVTPGSTAFAYIKFAPQSANTCNDTLTIVHDGTNQSPQIDISLSGTGKTAQSQSFSYTGSIVNWTVPAGVSTIRIEAWGAQGGGPRGGKGARVRGDFIVTPGETLKILVGENGYVTNQGDYGAGGGGGSYVYRNASDPLPLIIAAGGGGQCESLYGGDASHTETPTNGKGTGAGNGGTGGNGGDGGQNLYKYSTGGGGAGWLTDGKDGVTVRNPQGEGGQCPRNGAAGGVFTHSSSSFCTGTAGDGGFGGGGGMSDNSGAGGGGAGWNGGGGGTNYNNGIWGSGGGAGSYNGGSSKDGSSAVQTGHGKIEISY